MSSNGTQEAPIEVRRICCVGAGYVGGPTAAVVAFQNPNIQVTVVDRDTTRIRRWNSRHPPIYEPGLHDIVRIARDGGRPTKISNEPTTDSEGSSAEDGEIAVAERKPNLFFSTDIAKHISEADIVLVAVNTPTKYRGVGAGSATDMTAFEAVTGVVAQYAREGAIIVEKSTVPCRTAQLVADTVSTWSMLQQRSGQMLTM
jgi:UDPglucose 6-dehydrogenase